MTAIDRDARDMSPPYLFGLLSRFRFLSIVCQSSSPALRGSRGTRSNDRISRRVCGRCRLVGVGKGARRSMTIRPSARAEYVFGCMKANGETRQSIEQCSCSIDVVASLVPYTRCITAETALSMSQVRGNLSAQFRTSEQANSAINDVRRAQAEAGSALLLALCSA